MIKSYRLQNWSDAESKLHGLISADSNNKLYQLYADRIQFFKTNPLQLTGMGLPNLKQNEVYVFRRIR